MAREMAVTPSLFITAGVVSIEKERNYCCLVCLATFLSQMDFRALGEYTPAVEKVWMDFLEYWSSETAFVKLRDVVFAYLAMKYVVAVVREVWGYGIVRSCQRMYRAIAKWIFAVFLSLPFVRAKVQKEVAETRTVLEGQLIINAEGVRHRSVPEKGASAEQVLRELDALSNIKAANWQGGMLSGAVYHGGAELVNLQTEAYHKFSVANQLHPDAFPGVRQMEAEVVSMVLRLFNAPESGCGTTSSGGSESLLLACLAAREMAKATKGITEPEIVAPKTIHAAVFKASKYFGMKLKLADLDPETFTVDVNHMKRLITPNTAIILGSAANFPYGTIDDIEALSKLAVRYNIPLHVDCCLGSFVIAFYEKATGKKLAPFDFRLPGVTSISCDTHKYGFAPKGSSVIMYRSPEYRKYQYYISSDWVGGLYGSPTLAGSRPGALTVGAWATMIYLGEDGYVSLVSDIIKTAQRLEKAIREEIPELDVIGNPKLSVVAFKSSKINVHSLGDMLGKKGWHLSSLQQPAALHLAVTRLTIPVIDNLITDLKACVKECVQIIEKEGPEGIKSDTAQLYGVAESLSTASVVDELVGCFLDVLYQTDKTQN